jgi:SMC interacting uncharacterized protein involved in chromosome segregation
MADKREDLDRLLDDLARQRDELRLKLHLAKAEARDEFDRLERQWEQVRAKLPQLRAAVGESAQDVGAAAKLVAEEIKRGYERIRKLF